MQTLSVNSSAMVGKNASRRALIQKVLLACGILSSLLYVAATILGAMHWEGYSSISQSVSELIAIDAPSAPFVIPLFIIYAVLIFAFGAGIWMSAGGKRVLRIAASLIIIKEVLGVAATLFAPMHMRGIEATSTDAMHAIFTGVGVLLCMFPAIGFGAAAFGKRFRVYSILTMLVFITFGILAGMDGSRIAANLPTPVAGVWERINIFAYMLWIIVLSVTILRQQAEKAGLKK